MDRRDMTLVASFAKRFVDQRGGRSCILKDWGDHEGWNWEKAKPVTAPHSLAAIQVAELAATAYVLKHETEFSALYPDLASDIKESCDVTNLNEFAQYVMHPFLESAYVLGGVGTMDDYDMTLSSLAHMLFLFLDDHVVIPDHVGWAIICQNGRDTGCTAERHYVEWDGTGGYMTFGLERDYFAHEWGSPNKSAIWRAETENHVLMIYAWNYLASLWVLLRGPNSFDNDLSDMWAEGHSWIQRNGNTEIFFDHVMQALGRPLHSGFFETNARPYQELTLSAIMSLALYGGLPSMPDFMDLDQSFFEKMVAVRQAAQNAMDYSAAIFAFQSLRSKRSAPHRRRKEYRKSVDFYQGNRAPVFFGNLSGAHEYDDCMEADAAYKCRMQRFTGVESKHKTFWSAVGRLNERWAGRAGYELPEVIQGQMFDRRPYFSIMQARYGSKNYPTTVDPQDPPKYFLDGDPPQVNLPNEDFRGVPELYFGDGELMLAAGGMAAYFQGGNKLANEYRFRAKPIMLFPRGDFGYSDDKNTDSPGNVEWSGVKDASAQTLLMRGVHDEFWDSKCNVWVYGNLAYGYDYEDGGSVGGGWHGGWAQEFPDTWWKSNPYMELTIGHTQWKLMYLAPGAMFHGVTPMVGSASGGYYMILAKFRKDQVEWSTDPIFWNYRRGLVEVVPGYLYDSVEDLAAELQAWNPPHHFSDVSKPDAPDYPYRYVTMTSHERVTLDPGMGWGGWDKWEDCRNGVRDIETLVDPTSGPLGSDDDARWVSIDREKLYIPRNIRSDDERMKIPLVNVWELDRRYRRTGRMLMESTSPGRIIVRRRVMVEMQTGEPVPGWQCLDLDSSDYRKPTSSEYEVIDYRQCGPMSPSFNANELLQVAAGGGHTCALTSEHKLYCWGSNNQGQIGTGSSIQEYTSPQLVEILPALTHAIERVTAGSGHTCATISDGRLFCWGENVFGQLGTGNTYEVRSPHILNGFGGVGEPKVRSVAAGMWHTCALDGDGRVYCWGANNYGQLGVGSSDLYSTTPLEVGLSERAVAIALGAVHTCAIAATGSLYCWGDNQWGELGDGTRVNRNLPTLVSFEEVYGSMPEVYQVALGGAHTCALIRTQDATEPLVSCWGINYHGQLGVDVAGGEVYSALPVSSTALQDSGALPSRLAVGQNSTCVLDDDGTAWCWGDNTVGQLGNGQYGSTTRTAELVDVQFPGAILSMGENHACLTSREDGSLWCWGSNLSGQLGLGGSPSPTPSPTPLEVTFP
ncbi:MAG: hypothetical protein RBU30_02775 [Polyangia bacterium]|jgi:alpha-tubulin suppressor-like RCC1 family protein|nr:hypothetical protein [Polyangia bacterium]